MENEIFRAGNYTAKVVRCNTAIVRRSSPHKSAPRRSGIRFTTIFMSLLPDYSFFAYFCAIAAAAAAATVSAGTTAPVAVSIVTPVAGSVTHVAGLITGTAVARPFASNT